MRRPAQISAAALAATVLLGGAVDAYACRQKNQPRARQGAIVLTVPPTCVSQNVLASAKAADASQVRSLTLRLDGAVIGTTTRARPHFVGVGVDCAALSVGTHTLTATLVRRDGSRVEATRTLTRVDGPEPDEL